MLIVLTIFADRIWSVLICSTKNKMNTFITILFVQLKNTYKINVNIYPQFRQHGSSTVRKVFPVVMESVQEAVKDAVSHLQGAYLIKHLEITSVYQTWTRKGRCRVSGQEFPLSSASPVSEEMVTLLDDVSIIILNPAYKLYLWHLHIVSTLHLCKLLDKVRLVIMLSLIFWLR